MGTWLTRRLLITGNQSGRKLNLNSHGWPRPETLDRRFTSRLHTYPFKLRNGQFIEASIQGYTGKYPVSSVSDTTTGQKGFLYNDQRIAVSLIVYPQPFGFQAEYNWGTGPE